MSTRPGESGTSDTRRSLYLIVLAGVVVLSIAAIGLHFTEGAPPVLIVSCSDGVSGPFEIEVESRFETEKIEAEQPWRIWGRREAGQIPLEASLGGDAAQGADAYIERMLAALSVDAKLVRRLHSTSCFTPQNTWIARYDALVLQTGSGRLDAVHLVTFRELGRDKLIPYLLRADKGDQHIFQVSLEPSTLESDLSVPFFKFLVPGEPAIAMRFESDPSIDQGALLEEFEAPDFVRVKE